MIVAHGGSAAPPLRTQPEQSTLDLVSGIVSKVYQGGGDRGCSHIMSAKKFELAYPPSPPCQKKSEIVKPPLPPS